MHYNLVGLIHKLRGARIGQIHKGLMAGRLPGVGLSQRKRSSSEHNHHRYEPHATYRASYLREPPPWIPVTALDEATLKARQRLQKKLGHFFSSDYREGENPRKEASTFQKKDAGIGRKLLASSWLLLHNKYKKDRKVCAVCLEEFQQEQHVMNLSCSHKYHSECLLPWLAAHSHCPYCRAPVQLSHIYTC